MHARHKPMSAEIQILRIQQINQSIINQTRIVPSGQWPIFEGLNNWIVVDCSEPIPAKTIDTEHLLQIILEQQAIQTRENIVTINVGVISTDDPLEDGYFYLIQWDGAAPYQTEVTVTTLKGTMSPTIISRYVLIAS
jgi:hypothetical protein